MIRRSGRWSVLGDLASGAFAACGKSASSCGGCLVLCDSHGGCGHGGLAVAAADLGGTLRVDANGTEE